MKNLVKSLITVTGTVALAAPPVPAAAGGAQHAGVAKMATPEPRTLCCAPNRGARRAPAPVPMPPDDGIREVAGKRG